MAAPRRRSSKVIFQKRTGKSLVVQADPNHRKPDNAYVFSNGRVFKAKRDPYS